MASQGAGIAVAAGAFAANPILGFAVLTAAGLFDAYVTYPALRGKGKNAARPPSLLDIQTGSNEAGAPRGWAIGRRVRVPVHILWQDEKVRETSASSTKGGALQQRRVFFDCLLALNDRKTRDLVQLIGNGKLLLMKTLNLLSIESASMTASQFSGMQQLSIQMGSNLDPDFSSKFKVDDIVQLDGFVQTGGSSAINHTPAAHSYWKVLSLGGPSAIAGSQIILTPYSGQSVTSMAATGGSAFSPASITRTDDALFLEGNLQVLNPGLLVSYPNPIQFFADGGHLPCDKVFSPGDVIRFHPGAGAAAGFTAGTFTVKAVIPTAVFASASFPLPPFGSYQAGTATHPGRLLFDTQPRFAGGFFPSTFSPDAHYQDGSDTQAQSALLVAAKGNDVPAYRGTAVQGLDQFYVTPFGDSLPFAMEGLIDPDSSMTWAQAVSEILQRGGIEEFRIDTTGVSSRPFLGYFIRGAVPTATVLQPVLLAGRLVGQDRNGIIAIYDIANADVVTVRDSAEMTDLDMQPSGGQRGDNRVSIEDVAEEDLPTSVGVRHQDPDNQYAPGYQHFGLRHPEGVEHQNEIELDLSTLVLTRKEARDLAATHMRSEWVSRRRVRFTLGANYLDVLENDVIVVNDTEGNPMTLRLLQRDIGSDLRVSCVGIVEDVSIPVGGSAVTSASSNLPPPLTQPAGLTVVPLDIPGLTANEIDTPAIKLAVCANVGSSFAGAQVWESVDGSNFVRVADVTAEAGLGLTTGSLAPGTAAESYGTTVVTVTGDEVDVEFESTGQHVLEDASLLEVGAGKNWIALVGSDGTVEIAAYTTATFVSGTTWTLGGLLRGLRGTTPATFAEGTRVVLLSPFHDSGIVHREFSGAATPLSLSYKIVPAGAGLDDVESIQVVAQWRNFVPLPVRKVTKTIGGSPFHARFTVTAHWCRDLLPLGTQPPHPMDEPYERYRLTIYDPTGSQVRRTKTLLADQLTGSPHLRDAWFDYTASEQTADGYTPAGAETFWIDVQQISGTLPVATYPSTFGLGPSIKQEL